MLDLVLRHHVGSTAAADAHIVEDTSAGPVPAADPAAAARSAELGAVVAEAFPEALRAAVLLASRSARAATDLLTGTAWQSRLARLSPATQCCS